MWLDRVTRTYPACVWLNPVAEEDWDYTHSIHVVRPTSWAGRMYPLTLDGPRSRDAGIGAWVKNMWKQAIYPAKLDKNNPMNI